MTRKEKIDRLHDFCNSRESCSPDNCPVRIPDENDASIHCKFFRHRTDEELDATLRAIGAMDDTPEAAEPTGLDHPNHYNREGAMECIEEMLLIFGPEETMIFCKLNAWKYRYRAADKGGAGDLKKSDRYLAKYKELKERTT